MERYYTSDDLARISPKDCEGCGECCRGMGDTILLDPYDEHMLASAVGKPFSSMIGQQADLTVVRGLILPYLAMQAETDACSFLGQDGRCSIHERRPGICRLYPLARRYTEQGITYFIPDESCKKAGKSKVRISRWLGYGNLREYEAFKAEWHLLSEKLMEYLEKEQDPREQKQVNSFILENFFFRPYAEGFFEDFRKRAKRIKKLLGIVSQSEGES